MKNFDKSCKLSKFFSIPIQFFDKIVYNINEK